MSADGGPFREGTGHVDAPHRCELCDRVEPVQPWFAQYLPRDKLQWRSIHVVGGLALAAAGAAGLLLGGVSPALFLVIGGIRAASSKEARRSPIELAWRRIPKEVAGTITSLPFRVDGYPNHDVGTILEIEWRAAPPAEQVAEALDEFCADATLCTENPGVARIELPYRDATLLVGRTLDWWLLNGLINTCVKRWDQDHGVVALRFLNAALPPRR
jgi:hypothetical protein